MNATDLTIIAPEIILSLYAMGALLIGVYAGKDRLSPLLTMTTAVLFFVVAVVIATGVSGTNVAFQGMFVDDSFARFAKVLILLSAALVLLVGQDHMDRSKLMKFEYPVLITLAVVGMMVMVSAGDLITLYMGLELQSLALYVVASLKRDDVRSTEAGLKYFVLGALSSGLILYGSSLIYGYAGTTIFAEIILATQSDQLALGLLFGLVFVFSGLAFKVSAVPFHMWTPDVYQGAPTPVVALFATAPKVAAMVLFARFAHDVFGGSVGDWQQIIVLLSVASMFLGAVAAIGQTDIKRLMAYSSIAHMGFALMGLAAGTDTGVQAMLIYMAIYVVMNLGTFAFILSMQRSGEEITEISALNMLSKDKPLYAAALAILMFSLAGIPPMLGFIGKFAVLQAAVDAGLIWLAVLGVIASVIGAFYYLRIIYFMYFGQEGEALDTAMPALQSGTFLVAAGVMLVGLLNLFGFATAVEAGALAAAQALLN